MDIKLIIAGFLLMTFGGGIWSLPAIKLTRSREPWLTILLLAGLAGTVVGLRYLISHGFQHDLWVWLAAVGVFLFFRFVMGMKRSIEPFFAAHMTAIMLCFMAAAFDRHSELRHRSTHHWSQPTLAHSVPLRGSRRESSVAQFLV